MQYKQINERDYSSKNDIMKQFSSDLDGQFATTYIIQSIFK